MIVELIFCMIGGDSSTLVLVMLYSVYEGLLAIVPVYAVSIGAMFHN